MKVPSLGHVPARRGVIGEPLPLHDDDLVDVLGQYSRGQEPRDARTDNDRRRHPVSLTYASGQEKGAAEFWVGGCGSLQTMPRRTGQRRGPADLAALESRAFA
jgi:hypothetical protein